MNFNTLLQNFGASPEELLHKEPYIGKRCSDGVTFRRYRNFKGSLINIPSRHKEVVLECEDINKGLLKTR